MIVREHYLQQIRPFYESDLIKVITGIRRCGKSVIMNQIEEELRRAGKRTLKINFEDRGTFRLIPDADALEERVCGELGNDKLYVFLDEVQVLKDWNAACRSLRLKNLSLFVTGSNSKLLSREFTRELSGRYVSFRVRPFVYRELQEYARELGREYSVSDYLVYGGFPKIAEYPGKAERLRYLNDLDAMIVAGGIMSRCGIRKTEIFRRLADFVLLSSARIFSASSVQKSLKGDGFSCSLATVMKYLSYLEEAYVVSSIPQFSTKAKRELRYYRKLYDEDVAFSTIRQGGDRFDVTHNLENIVWSELLFRGFSLSVFTKDGLEIDFLAEKDGRQYLIQVAYSIAEESTYRREFALFGRIDQSRRKIIITADDFDYSTSTVRHIRLRDFLEGAEL